ncbi:MAG: AAA domain-containing protein [Acholeplasmataceae bacterium]|jgi:DNA polymerase III delta prime subunit|nr:AAA domain-containing protein [Acholeplasmataceae bacterium]
MGERVIHDKIKNLILLYSSEKRMWEDRTSSIMSLYKAYYYGNFTGYDIYFKGANAKFFYKAENVQILDFIKNVDISGQDVIVDNEIIDAKSVELFQNGYYKITIGIKTIISRNLKLKSGKYKDIYAYYSDLARYAGQISKDDEPLNFLSQNYQRIKPSLESVLYHYLEGRYEKVDKQIGLIIVPFDFNQSQHTAIYKALENSISVIEGPPGTGKTQTILNLISNIISRNMNCAIVSNNNTAIDNVHDKLSDEGIGFVSATLGRLDNVTTFFENNGDEDLNQFLESAMIYKDDTKKKNIDELSALMKRLHETEIEIARLKNELNAVHVEQKNQPEKFYNRISIYQKLSSKEYLKLINRLEKEKKIGFFERWKINHKYKVKLHKIDINEAISMLEQLFYESRINEINITIDKLNTELSKNNKDKVLNDLKKISKDYLIEAIKNHYEKIDKKTFDKESYKQDYHNFLKRYPVVLSTSQSLLNNAPKGFLFDYLIIDEASQGDLLSSVIAMSCARKLVVVGDSRQLQQIDEERLFKESNKLAQRYNIQSSFRYESNSILKSVRESVLNVPTTLLREHYRCAPDIINFCNKMFYDDELIPMTNNTGMHLEIIKTVTGNHARKNPNGTGMYNQREIDEIVELFKGNDLSRVGVITPFKYQARLIQEHFKDSKLEADTIHKFQGRQKDEVYLSFVVNSLDKNPDQVENRLYDFVTNEKLLNVAISRGKNKVTAILSDKIYYSKNNIIHDLIHYIENLYGSSVTKTSSIISVFDYLYDENNKLVKELIASKPKEHQTELLFSQLVDETLKSYKKIGYAMHTRLSKIVNDTTMLDDDEKKYVLHPWTHVDFLFYNKISKERLFVIEVDGIKYHEQSIRQTSHDEIKNKVLFGNGLPIYRFKTNESNEKNRLIQVLNLYSYN